MLRLAVRGKIRDMIKQASIPQTDSIEELAKFWDTHDVTDFEDALEPELLNRLLPSPLPLVARKVL